MQRHDFDLFCAVGAAMPLSVVVMPFFVENKLVKCYERLNVFILGVHYLCVILVYVDILERVEVQSSMF